MTIKNKKICIVGAGGSGRETLWCLMDSLQVSRSEISQRACFMVDDQYLVEDKIMGVEVIPRSTFDPSLYEVVVSVGDSSLRKKIVEDLPLATIFTSIIHPKALISEWVEIGEGAVITAGTIITCNVKIGKHVQLNLNTTISHDCIMGDFFTTGPGVNICGNCTFGNQVYFGANSCARQKISISDNVFIGMGGVVVKDITNAGVYIGNPVKRLLN